MINLARSTVSKPRSANPFNLEDEAAYIAWKQWKLIACQLDGDPLIVPISDPYSLQPTELSALTEQCRLYNLAIYQLRNPAQSDKSLVQVLGKQLGLERLDTNLRADEDSITSLHVRAQTGNQYIPYTNRPMSWHTDGYYNALDQQIRGIIMHCVKRAASGGENSFIDHELLYIRLRDRNPAIIHALMQPEAMTIPPNIEAGVEIRGAQTGPVFSVDPDYGSLHMRYSARKKNIEWFDDVVTRQAADMITECLADDSLVIRHRLESGQGIVCNNVLHKRAGFEAPEQQQRLMYRARYYDRVQNTGLASGDMPSHFTKVD